MRKIKNNSNHLKDDSIVIEDESKYLKQILLLGWLIPFFGLYVVYFMGIKLPKRTKMVMCELLNKNFTMTLFYIAILTPLRSLTGTEFGGKLLSFLVFVFIASIIFQIRKTIAWLKGENARYKYTFKFFKEAY